MNGFSVAQVTGQLGALGVRPGGVLLVHTAFRAVRPMEGGPAGLIEALTAALGPQGTLVMPAMTAGDAPFDPATTPTFEMGATAETFRQLPGVVRSGHPGASFAARGPAAQTICAPQPLSPPHGLDSPVGRVYVAGGQVLLLGVGHSESTTLHLAEALAGVPYSVTHPCVVVTGGEVRTIEIAETDHCCANFARMDGWLRAAGQQREGPVGHAHARLFDAQAAVAVARDRLARDPLVFLCQPDAGCEECNRARASVASRPRVRNQ